LHNRIIENLNDIFVEKYRKPIDLKHSLKGSTSFGRKPFGRMSDSQMQVGQMHFDPMPVSQMAITLLPVS
jgi:hypothetical protein